MAEDTEVPNISEKASRHTVTSLKVSTVKKTASTAKAGSLTTMISATCVLPLSVLPLMRTVILSSKRASINKEFPATDSTMVERLTIVVGNDYSHCFIAPHAQLIK